MRQLRKGLKNTLPDSPDKRLPLLLPLVMHNPYFTQTNSTEESILQCATILGFLGMMRPHSLEALGPASFYLVLDNGTIIPMPDQPQRFREILLAAWGGGVMAGAFAVFKSKTMSTARAHFPNLSRHAGHSSISTICPILSLAAIANRGLMKKYFLKPINKKKRLTMYLQRLTGLQQYISPYAMRIGGRTWYLANGMERQLVDFLGTWKCPEASFRYYRAAPQLVLRSMTRFFVKRPIS